MFNFNTCGLQLWGLIVWVGHGYLCMADRLGKYFIFIPNVLVLLLCLLIINFNSNSPFLIILFNESDK
jgi:hypothetical protein